MPGFGCMRRIVALFVLVVVIAVGWFYRDALRGRVDALLGRTTVAAEPSPELADQAEAKLNSLGEEDGPARIALSEAELQSLVDYRLAGFLPAYVIAPRIRLTGDRLRLQARVPTDALPRIRELRDVMAFLPDTTEITASGRIVPLDGERAALSFDDVSAARIPLPRRLIPVMLRQLGREAGAAGPEDALPIPLPAGATGAYIGRDSLIFVGGTRSAP
jgi:hypothetical protein